MMNCKSLRRCILLELRLVDDVPQHLRGVRMPRSGDVLERLLAAGALAAAEETFLQQVGPWASWYLIWMATANVISIVLLMRLRGRIDSPGKGGRG